MEAGIGAVVRAGQADRVLVVTEPSAKSLDVARRAVDIAGAHAEVLVIANRVRDEGDLSAISVALAGQELVVVPEDPAIARADREGIAPIDADPAAPGVRALTALAERLVR